MRRLRIRMVVAVVVGIASVASSVAATPVVAVSAQVEPLQDGKDYNVVGQRLEPGEGLDPHEAIVSPGNRAVTVMQQADSHMMMYHVETREPRWGNRVYGEGGGILLMEHNGSLVTYGPTGNRTWGVDTGVPGASVAMEADGRLVIRGPDGAELWARGDALPPLPTPVLVVDVDEGQPASPRPEGSSIGGHVGAAGIKVDLFHANLDGVRTEFVGPTHTGEGGRYQFDGLKPGCYTLVLIAPEDMRRWVPPRPHVWIATGGKYQEISTCVDGQVDMLQLDGELRGPDQPQPDPEPEPEPAADIPPIPTGPVGRDEVVKVYDIWIHKSMAAGLRGLIDEAAEAGYTISGWGWRDQEDQIRLRKKYCGTSKYAIYEMPSSQCRPPVAIPGRSRHQWGTAVDLTNNGKQIRPGTAVSEWLKANGPKWGFHNFPRESWHYSHDGA